MMKKLIGTGVLALLSIISFAAHISGGEMFYKYIGPGANGTLRYEITLRLFRDCDAGGTNVATMPTSVIIGLFENLTNGAYSTVVPINVSRTRMDRLSLDNPSPCIINAPRVCYDVGYFTFTRDLARNEFGYTIAYQTCCRIDNISNTIANGNSESGSPGATYVARIPGSSTLGATDVNSSPVFALSDASLVCRGNNLTLDFSATDPDGDELTYEFCSAYGSGTKGNAAESAPSSPAQYNNLSYQAGYSGASPLGSNVSINGSTGIISGIAPTGGNIRPNGVSYFVVNVCITERRNGNVISTHRKDFILKVTACQIADADLPINAVTCDGLSYTFSNLSNSSLIRTYYWDFGVPGSTPSTAPSPTFVFPTPGDYTVKLVINRNGDCSDSATTTVGVYPGFNTDFEIVAGCVDVPVKFIDKTVSQHGTVNSWKWDFGDLSTTTDISSQQNPDYKYGTSGTRNVMLISGNDKGCTDTLYQTFELPDKPVVQLGFRDTLICSIDTLQLRMNGPGTYTWSPNYMISDLTVAEPLVSPDVTTTYIVDLDYLGCKAQDSVKVNVVDFVTLYAGNDTTICLTDDLTLKPETDALYFLWTPAGTLDRDNVKNPVATPVAAITTYQVIGSIGKCSATDEVTVFGFPYPIVNAGQDHVICTDSLVLLTGTHNADRFSWSPASTLLNSNTLTPTAFPATTTEYYLTAQYLTGCLKPVTDTALVTVIPPVPAFAGNDTAIVVGQPLLLNATGGDIYEWDPPLGLSNTRIFNPIANISSDQTYSVKVITNEGCYAYDTMSVKVFRTAPDIFVPNAFSPNGDGHNDIFRAYPVGIAQFNYFRVYNRWGQLVFSTSTPSAGWDGKINGKQQSTGTFVWQADGVDYTGKKVFRKGTAVLVK